MWGTWKGAPSTLLKHTSEKGQHRSKVCCPSLSWGSFLESWSQHLCHHLQVWTRALDYHWTCHIGAQTHCLTGDKHLGCYTWVEEALLKAVEVEVIELREDEALPIARTEALTMARTEAGQQLKLNLLMRTTAAACCANLARISTVDTARGRFAGDKL